MAQDERHLLGALGVHDNRTALSITTNMASASQSDEDADADADADEPPDLERTPRPSGLKLHDAYKASFSKSKPQYERKESLLSNALHSNMASPVDEQSAAADATRGLSCASVWSNNSMSAAELTSDGGFTSPGTRASTPSPPLSAVSFNNMAPLFNQKPFELPVAIVRHEDESIDPLQKTPTSPASRERDVEVTLGRKRCITFACGPKAGSNTESKPVKDAPPAKETAEPPKRASTIKFACPAKVSTDAPSKPKARTTRAVSPAPETQHLRSSSKASAKSHHNSDATVRNVSPAASRKQPTSNRLRRLSGNAELARCAAYRFHEFASAEEEVEEWTMESTCHRRPLTIKDTLSLENNLRKLGEEAEAEAIDDEDDDDDDDDDNQPDEDDVELDDEDDDLAEQAVHEDDASSSDEGFRTDDEGGFTDSDGESDAGSDYNWWAPTHSTAATSFEHLDLNRPASRRSMSGSSIGSLDSSQRYRPEKVHKRRKSQPVNIRVPSPELPDSTDFVCGTLDEDRPLEDAYMSALERRRAAKRQTPQDIDPTFPTSDPEMDEEDDDDEHENLASESDHQFMVHGQMDPPNGDLRGRRRSTAKRSPAHSPKRLRSPPPPAKRTGHRSPPPRKLFGQSPRRLQSPPAAARLRSPPPTRRGSATTMPFRRPGLSIQFAGLAQRPMPTMSTSLPRTPVLALPPDIDEDDEDTPNEFPVRRAIDIKVGLERKRQRRKEQLYKKMHRKGVKEKRPAPGKGCERMREVGLGLAAHKGRTAGFNFLAPPTPDSKDMHVLSV